MTHTDSPPLAQLPAIAEESFISSGQANGWTAARQRGFCEALAQSGRVDQAAREVGMTRDAAYKLRGRASGRAFAFAWDAALLMARQRLIDEAMELAFEGSIEQIVRDGKVIAERRKRDANTLLAVIERLGRPGALGSQTSRAIASEFDEFLECMAMDAEPQDEAETSCEAGDFLMARGSWAGASGESLRMAGEALDRAMGVHPAARRIAALRT